MNKLPQKDQVYQSQINSFHQRINALTQEKNVFNFVENGLTEKHPLKGNFRSGVTFERGDGIQYTILDLKALQELAQDEVIRMNNNFIESLLLDLESGIPKVVLYNLSKDLILDLEVEGAIDFFA